MKTIYTIGHSTRPVDTFLSILQSFGIKVLADVRSFPGSKRHPQYNRQALQSSLTAAGISYVHFPDLGGKRQNAVGVTTGLSGYAEYMNTETFKEAIRELQAAGEQQPLAYMCAEASWRNCHRSYISRYLYAAGWQVQHITGEGVAESHNEANEQKPIQGSLFT